MFLNVKIIPFNRLLKQPEAAIKNNMKLNQHYLFIDHDNLH